MLRLHAAKAVAPRRRKAMKESIDFMRNDCFEFDFGV